MKAFFLACVLALAAVPAHADTVMAIVSSDATEWVGQGQQKTYTNANATFTVAGNKSRLQVRVVGTDGKTWDLFLKAPVGDELRAGEYFFAEREGFETGRAPGMDFSGDGRACGDVYGDFTIRQIGFDALGRVNMLEATVLQRCDSDLTAPLAMVVMYRAARLVFSLDTKPGDWAGQSIRMYGDTSTFTIDGQPNYQHISVSGLRRWFFMTLQPPYGEPEFHKGTYLTMTYQTGNLAGMSFAADHQGGGGYGKLEILTISYINGALRQLSARYTFYSDAARTQVMRSGVINLWE